MFKKLNFLILHKNLNCCLNILKFQTILNSQNIKKNLLINNSIQKLYFNTMDKNLDKVTTKDTTKIELPNAVEGKVVTRFPPEPSGYLHIGHVKAAMLNYHYAKKYNGKMILRFDDTNPEKEKDEYVQNIISDLKLLEIIPDQTTHTSDYFDHLQSLMTEFIKKGDCYCDNTDVDIVITFLMNF